MTRAYYNEIEPYAAAWLRNLIKKGLIADGEVDERSIVDIRSSDLRGFRQCHFFAGIGVWSYALRLAGWPDARPVWTGSCPCQPFSAAGKGKGFDDERHLWPVFHRLIAECRPPVVFGEQVASKDGLQWLDAVCADMEASGYAIGAADLCAAGVGAPHIRQRLWFVGERLEHAESDGRKEWRPEPSWRGAASRRSDERLADAGGMLAKQPARQRAGSDEAEGRWASGELTRRGDAYGLGHDHDTRLEGQRRGHQAESGWIGEAGSTAEAGEPSGVADASEGGCAERGSAWVHGDGQPRHYGAGCGEAGGVADSISDGRGARRNGDHAGDDWHQPDASRRDGGVADAQVGRHSEHERNSRTVGRPRSQNESQEPEFGRATQAIGDRCENVRPRSVNGHWRDADWLHCRDGKWRPVEPGTFPLAHGAAARVGRLRAYGNAIVPQVAAEVIAAFMEARS